MQTQYQFQTADKIIAGAYRFEQLAIELQEAIQAHRSSLLRNLQW
ncbi:hypothetical protein [Geomicrobium sp. JCM 19055]|nr:hypothetical protein [Geomicrobium sp. JCM 19055]